MAASAEKYKELGTLRAARVIDERIEEEEDKNSAGDELDQDGDDPIRLGR